MQLTIRTKVTYGFLILAFGMMLTDVCKLMRAPSERGILPPPAAPSTCKILKRCEGGVTEPCTLPVQGSYLRSAIRRAGLDSPRHVSDQRDEEQHDEDEE